jgi:hypothetical protein
MVVDFGGFNVCSVKSVVIDVNGFDRMVECATEHVVHVIVGVGMVVVESVQLVGYKVDMDSLGVSVLTTISCSSAGWELSSSASLESESAPSRSQSLCNMPTKSFAASEVSMGRFASNKVSLLGVSISGVMTSGLKGWIPVL